MARLTRGRRRGRGLGRGHEHAGEVEPEAPTTEHVQPQNPQPLHHDNQALTPLLQMPHSNHRVSTIRSNQDFVFTTKAYRVRIPYHSRCEAALKRLGLYHIAQIGHTNTDKGLITALVERWRPETHTFHMPVGEMTVTLQDVACLWGLPVDGVSVSGVSNKHWNEVVAAAFGRPVDDSTFYSKKKIKRGQNVMWSSRFSLSLKWLRGQFPSLSDEATPLEVECYTRAFVMDLFGSLMFPDTSGTAVPVMNLSVAARSTTKTIAGPLALLQVWTWTWLNVTRPQPMEPFTDWGMPDLESCQPYGRYWTGNHRFKNNSHHNTSPTISRDDLDAIADNHVNWLPYKPFEDRMLAVVARQRDIWICRVPLIHFWIVSYYYPDRVMRQFGFAQQIPPPDPLSWDEHLRLDATDHTTRFHGTDWMEVRQTQIAEWDPRRRHVVPITGSYDISTRHDYMQWFETYGMRTGFLDRHFAAHVDQPRPPPAYPAHVIGYVPRGDIPTRMAYRTVKDAIIAVNCVMRRRFRKIGILMLKSCRGNLNDVGQDHRLDRLLRDAGLPLDVNAIPNDEPDDLLDMEDCQH